jgi:hypothetical protein
MEAVINYQKITALPSPVSKSTLYLNQSTIVFCLREARAGQISRERRLILNEHSLSEQSMVSRYHY